MTHQIILPDQATKCPGIRAERTPESQVSSWPSSKTAVQLDKGQRQLVFAPLAWLKLRFLLHAGDTEVGAFGIAAERNLLYIEDLAVPQQRTTQVSVEFEDAAVADHFDSCFDKGVSPARCGRIWIHSHPGSSPSPSRTDEETFQRAFGDCDWAVMAIIARGGATYARMRFATGPGGSFILPVVVDWQRLPEDLLEHEGKLDELMSGWMDEYGTAVHPIEVFELGCLPRNPAASPQVTSTSTGLLDQPHTSGLEGFLDEVAGLDELHEEQFMDERLWERGYWGSFDETELMR